MKNKMVSISVVLLMVAGMLAVASIFSLLEKKYQRVVKTLEKIEINTRK